MNFHSRQHGRGGTLLGGFSSLLALGSCVFTAPALWPLVDGTIWENLIRYYDLDVAIWLHWAAWLAMFPATYHGLRLAFSAAFLAIALWLARRLV